MVYQHLNRHKAALLFLNGGLGNGIILAPVLRCIERALPGLVYFSPPNDMLQSDWLRNALALTGPKAILPPLWRRFLPADQAEIVSFAKSAGVTLVLNFRKEAASQDGHYFAFRQLAADHGIECWDLHELEGEELRLPIARQAARVLERHGIAAVIANLAWLNAAYQPRGGVIGISVGASVAVKRWPAERWSPVIGMLRDRGYAVEVAAGPDEAERAIACRLAAEHGVQPGVRLLSATTELRDWIASLDALISNDTLAVHLAAALGCPVVALYLATDGRIWSPVAAPGGFIAAQSQIGLDCELMKVDGTCHRFYAGCPAPCADGVQPDELVSGLVRLIGPGKVAPDRESPGRPADAGAAPERGSP
jgi:hypothetical protein